MIQGTEKIHTERRETSLSQSASIIAQHFVQVCKSDRQISHKPKNDECDFRYQSETPFSAGLALSIHKATRSKSLITKLEEIDLSVSYLKVTEIETAIANAVKKQMDAMNRLCLPSWLVENKSTWFALDNTCFESDTKCYEHATRDSHSHLPS